MIFMTKDRSSSSLYQFPTDSNSISHVIIMSHDRSSSSFYRFPTDSNSIRHMIIMSHDCSTAACAANVHIAYIHPAVRGGVEKFCAPKAIEAIEAPYHKNPLIVHRHCGPSTRRVHGRNVVPLMSHCVVSEREK